MEVLRSQNKSLRKQVATARSKTTPALKKTMKSVARRINMDEAE